MTLRLLLLSSLFLLISCKEAPPNTDSERPNREAIQKRLVTQKPSLAFGNDRASQLVKAHCSRCHHLPAPTTFSQQIWVNQILPEMGCYLGLHHLIPQYGDYLESGSTPEEKKLYAERNLYPSQPLISQADWDQIVLWFLQNSPKEMPASSNPIYPELPAGKFEVSFIGPPNPTPQTTYLQIDSANARFFASDSSDNSLSLYDASGQLQKRNASLATFTAGQLSDSGSPSHFLAVGTLIPNDQTTGAIFTGSDSNNPTDLSPSPIKNLKRPVSAVWTDLDNDGRDEVVVAEYGNKTGQLSLYHEDSSGSLTRRTLNQTSGNVSVKSADMNQDGWQDIIVLRAQELEEVVIYYNLGDLKFAASTVLKFHAAWGSNGLELADLNNDGHLDLLLANGDNADLTPVLKNYHGLHLYLNDGKGRFTLNQSFPIHGCYGVRAFDADLDGDLDLIAFSSFADFANDQASVIFFEHQDALSFQPYRIPQSTQSRWIVMDCGDLDNDGDADVVFGANLPGPSPIPSTLLERGRVLPGPFLLLRNLAQ
ncbi:MAG: FG-GAP repeat domain-containing protein [Roseibacillus sp.]